MSLKSIKSISFVPSAMALIMLWTLPDLNILCADCEVMPVQTRAWLADLKPGSELNLARAHQSKQPAVCKHSGPVKSTIRSPESRLSHFSV